jgi:hypothetical protein
MKFILLLFLLLTITASDAMPRKNKKPVDPAVRLAHKLISSILEVQEKIPPQDCMVYGGGSFNLQELCSKELEILFKIREKANKSKISKLDSDNLHQTCILFEQHLNKYFENKDKWIYLKAR